MIFSFEFPVSVFPTLLLSTAIPLSPLYNHGSFIRLFTSPSCLLAWHPNFIPRSSLGYWRQKLPSAIHPYALLYRAVGPLVGDHSRPASLARPSSGPIGKRLTVPPPSDGYRPVAPPPYPASTAESINTSSSPRSSHQTHRFSISSFQPPQETARLHPVGSAAVLPPRPSSPSSTISENESPGPWFRSFVAG